MLRISFVCAIMQLLHRAPLSCIYSFSINSHMDLKQEFDAAVIASKELSSKPSNEVLLQLYSLYKQATSGDADDDGPSNPFDFVGKAKHNAWVEQKGKTADVAMQEYVTLIEKLKN
jgi:diazepam-binding inhibitor (GABA receptor modulator, acyl-CoA-binding protein)